MKKILGFILIFNLFCLTQFSSVSYAQEQAKVIYVRGHVTINDIKAKIEMEVKANDRIITAKASYIEIGFGSSLKNNIKIDRSSRVVIKRITSRQIEIDLLDGKIFSLVEDIDAGETFRITTPVAVVGVRGTGWLTAATASQSEFSVFENQVFVRGMGSDGNLNKEMVVGQGWKAGIKKFEFPISLNKLSKQDMRKWKAWKKALSKHLNAFSKQGTKGSNGLDKKFKKVIDRTESSVEKNDMKKIEKSLEDQDDNVGGRKIVVP